MACTRTSHLNAALQWRWPLQLLLLLVLLPPPLMLLARHVKRLFPRMLLQAALGRRLPQGQALPPGVALQAAPEPQALWDTWVQPGVSVCINEL